MAQQTINVGAAPNDGTGTPLRTAFQYTNSNFTELYTALGGGSGLPGASTQVIFNDGGTNLAGSAGLVFNKTTSVLGVGTVNAGAAIVSGDLTVDTNTLKVDSANNRVGFGTASPAAGATTSTVGTTSVSASDYTGSSTWAARFQAAANNQPSGVFLSGLTSGGNVVPGSLHVEPVAASSRSALIATYAADSSVGYFAINRFSPSAGTTTQHFKIADDGVATWSNVGGVAGTAMTLNSTGLGVGVVPSAGKFEVQESGTGSGIGGIFASTASGGGNPGVVFRTASTNRWSLSLTGSAGAESIRFYDVNNSATRLLIDSSGNVGIGVTPSANRFQVSGNIGLPNSCTASGETSGVFSIDVANLLALTGSNWRQASILIVYSGIDGGATNPTVLQTVVTLTGLSTWDTIAKNDIVGTASVAVSSSTATGATITFTVPTGNSGSVYAMLLGGAGSTTRPSMTINA